MLSDDERAAIDHELAILPLKRAGCIGALRVVQGRRGWVDDEALRDVADYLQMSLAELDNVATFYNLVYRRPVGRHVILVCDSVSCWLTGSEQVIDGLRRRLGIDLGETTPDGRFTLLPMACLGACEQAPALMIDTDLYTDLDDAALERALERYE